ncbi:Ctf8p and Ctf18p associating protein [Malassezia obtusa]|uniref:Ctf8p and Ctf18p associating protein n=1 Tax=Malassezia obtusa TaxID=76774 RepID=A0AAF0ISG3_9BASI|nr:Ctf8p and Ctf18p associating protein [Malassezia obtusa]
MDGVALVTGASSDEKAYCLLEIPPELEAHLVPGSEAPPLTFNGRLVDEATLSTAERTYAVRQVTQSNSLLLCGVEPRDSGVQLRMLRNETSTIELVPTAARLDRLAALLDESAYAGEDHAAFGRRYTPHELRSIVQASEGELAEGLRMHHVLLLDGTSPTNPGHMRRVAPGFLYELLRVLLNQLDLLACEPDEVPYAPTLEALQMAARPEVAEKVLCDWFCAPPRPQGVPTHVALATPDIARFIGIHILREAKRMPLLAFVAEWKRALASLAAEAHLALLHGFYLLDPPPASFAAANTHTAAPADPAPDTLATAITIQYFPHTSLPLAPAQRFQDLFLLRTQWVREELVPFLDDLTRTGSKASSLESLLVKHARSSRARWTRVHAAVLLRGEIGEHGTPRARGVEECVLYQARVKY